MEQLSFKIRYCPLSTSKSFWNLTVFIILKHSSASSLIAQTNVMFKLRIQLTGLGCWFSLCSFIRNHGPNKRNAVLSCSVCKLLRNSPEAFISISVSSVQAWQCRCKVTLIFFSEGEMWHTQSSLPFFFFHQNAVRLLLLPAFKEILFVLYEANIDLKFLFVHRCGLYHRLIRAFSQAFCFVEGNMTRVDLKQLLLEEL